MQDTGAKPAIIQTVAYLDPDAALDWLVRVLGFRVATRYRGPDGRTLFAQAEFRTGIIFIAGRSDQDPWRHVGAALICLVAGSAADVAAHHERAVRAGAEFIRSLHTSVSPAFPNGCQQFDIRDLEGHFWTVSDYQPSCQDSEPPLAG